MNCKNCNESMFDKLVGFFIDMPSSWKKALFGAALTVGLVWIWDKFKDKILKALTGVVLDIQAWFGVFWYMFKGKLSGMGNQVMSVVADVEKYAGAGFEEATSDSYAIPFLQILQKTQK